MNIHTETVLRHFPMMALCAMENGGMCFSDDGEYVDAADLPLDPNRIWIDFENGDGDKGRIPMNLDDFETEEDDVLDDFETEEEELNRLTAEQAEDDASTVYIDTPASELEDDIVETDEIRGLVPIVRAKVESRGRRRATLRTCDRKDAVYRERDSHGFHGRK